MRPVHTPNAQFRPLLNRCLLRSFFVNIVVSYFLNRPQCLDTETVLDIVSAHTTATPTGPTHHPPKVALALTLSLVKNRGTPSWDVVLPRRGPENSEKPFQCAWPL